MKSWKGSGRNLRSSVHITRTVILTFESSRQQIAETETARDRIIADLKAKDSVSADPNTAIPTSDISEMRDPASPMVQVQGQLQSNRVEIASRERAVTDLKAKVIDYQARLNQEPVREQQLSDLTRGYEQSKANYDGLLKKKNESAMATSMELLQQGERFRVDRSTQLACKTRISQSSELLRDWAGDRIGSGRRSRRGRSK